MHFTSTALIAAVAGLFIAQPAIAAPSVPSTPFLPRRLDAIILIVTFSIHPPIISFTYHLAMHVHAN